MQPGDLVAIIRTSSGVGVLQQFTSDKRVLYAAIMRVRWGLNGRAGIDIFQPADPSDFGAAGSGTNLLRQLDEFRKSTFAAGTLNALNYVVKGMRELPGRKAVVLLSDGFELHESNTDLRKPDFRLLDGFQRLIDFANRASVIIYPLDARGVVNPLSASANDSWENFIKGGSPTRGRQSGDKPVSVVEQTMLDRSGEITESQQEMRELAAHRWVRHY